MEYATLWHRLKIGMSPEQAMTATTHDLISAVVKKSKKVYTAFGKSLTWSQWEKDEKRNPKVNYKQFHNRLKLGMTTEDALTVATHFKRYNNYPDTRKSRRRSLATLMLSGEKFPLMLPNGTTKREDWFKMTDAHRNQLIGRGGQILSPKTQKVKTGIPNLCCQRKHIPMVDMFPLATQIGICFLWQQRQAFVVISLRLRKRNQEQMGLDDTVIEMRKVAEENIFRPGIVNQEMVLVSEKTHRDIDYNGFKVGLTFSLDEMENVRLWHLTVSIDGQNNPPTNEFCEPILKAFFNGNAPMEIPPEHFPPELRHMRQFVSLIK